jgi:hypothetical protein
MLVMGGHVLATRGSSLVYGVDPELIGLRFSIAWLPWFFLPYYALFGVAGVLHVAQGVPVALGISVAMRGLLTERTRTGVAAAATDGSGRPVSRSMQKRVPKALTAPRTFWPVVTLFSFFALLGVAGIAGWLYATPENPFASDYAQIYRDMDDSPLVPDVPEP